MPYIGNQPGTGVRSRFIYTATASQTTFSGADDNSKTLKYADSAYVDVFLNGVCLVPGTDYTASTKTSIVLTQAASLSDTLEVVAYDIASMSDMSASNGGTFQADVTFAAGADIITASAGTDNVRLGENAGDSIASGGNYNVAIGKDAGTAITTGDGNVAVGYQALDAEDAHGLNTAIGYQALSAQNAGFDAKNTAVGYQAGAAVTEGDRNTLVGTSAGSSLTHADFNVAFGEAALASDTLGSRSTAIGRAALNAQNFTSATNTYNTAVGNNAGLSVTTAINNTLIGGLAGDAITTGASNTAVGAYAMTTLTTGADNVAVGTSALDVATTGSDCVAVGRNALGAQTDGTNNTAVGSSAGLSITSAASNTMVGHGAGQNTNSDKNTFIGRTAGYNVTSGAKNTILGRFNGNENSLDIRTLSNNIVLSDGDGNPRLLITSGGDITNNVGNVSSFSGQNAGFTARNGDSVYCARNNGIPLQINRIGNDGILIDLRQADTREGNISVSGATVSYNGFSGTHESSGVPTNTAIGTVVSTIDELDTYVSGTKSGQTRADHAKIKVSDTEGDKRIYGVISGYTEDDNKPLVASVGIGSVKVTGSCEGGDLLESNGDGTAKVQSDDIIRSKTIGKVTIGNSNTSVKLVSCVMYCG
jgi:hypothetical protein